MKFLQNRLIPSIFLTVWTIVFGILSVVQGDVLILGPILTGIGAIFFWISFIYESKKNKDK